MRKNGKILAGILAALLFFAILPLEKLVFAMEGELVADVSGGSAGSVENGDIFVDKVTLWDSDGNRVAGEVSTARQYRLRYDIISPLQIKLNTSDVCMPPYMEKGKEYILPGISDDFIYFTGDITVRATDSEGNIVNVATVRIGDDGIPVFILDDDLDKGSLLNGYFEVGVNLNQEKIGEQGDYSFTLPKGGSLHAEIAENRKLPPTIGKEAVAYDSDSNTITWKITVQNAANPLESLYPLSFMDVIGEGQTYVEGSFRITEPANLTPEEWKVSGNQLTWQWDDPTGNAVIRYEYQTKVDVLELLGSNITNADISVSAQNTLSVMGADGSRPADEIRADQTITGKTPVGIAKEESGAVQYNEENDSAEIEWIITITNNGYDIKDLTVYDFFEAGSASVCLKGEPVCDPLPSANGRGYVASEGTNNGKRYQWFYHIGDVSGNVTYTITYTTIIENYSEYLKKNNRAKPRNSAWFSFQYPVGDGVPPKEFTGLSASVEVREIHANIIEKAGVYDPATHRLTWTIMVNPNRIILPNAKITERIPDGQKYISSEIVISDNVTVTTAEDIENNTITFYFGEDGLSERTAAITLVTELEDSESGKWANNWSGVLQNNVTLNADALAEAGVSDTGRASAKSVVIAKEMGAFHYVDHTIPVTIIINQNSMELTGATVTDKLSEYGLELVKENGVRLNGISLDEGTEAVRPSYSYDGETLQIYPEKDITGEAKITFTVQATDSYMYDRRSKTTINFVNTATLTSDQYGEEVSVSDSVTMANRPIVKRGTLNEKTGIITYTVEFNRTLTDLPDGLILTDTLPAGLLFKQSTVKLWLADVNGQSGTLTKTGREAVGYTAKIFASGGNTVMQISLPGGKQAYILEYQVQIVDKDSAPFVNRVNVSGYPDDGTGENSLSFDRSQIAGARLEDLLYVKVKKADPEGNPLAGAAFALRQGEEEILMGFSGEDGYVTFVGVAANTQYTIVELQAPEGYTRSSEEWTFTTGTEIGREYALEKIFINQDESAYEENKSEKGSKEPGHNDSADASDPSEAMSREQVKEGEEMDVLLEQNRLPKTGGFWGSGIMYIIGAMGVLLMAFTFLFNIYAKWRNAREVSAFEEGLLVTKSEQPSKAAETDSQVLQEASARPMTVQELRDKNGVLAALSIPSISCKEVVKEGSDRGTLAKALGHMEGTALPGQVGNCVIVGHRNYNFGLYFNRLNEVAIGDEITISTKEGTYTYIVMETKVVEPEEVSVLGQTEEANLTLITCTPIYIATHRLIVVAVLSEGES